MITNKVRTFWEAHKNLRNLPHALYIYLVNVQTMRNIFQMLCASQKVRTLRKIIWFICTLWIKDTFMIFHTVLCYCTKWNLHTAISTLFHRFTIYNFQSLGKKWKQRRRHFLKKCWKAKKNRKQVIVTKQLNSKPSPYPNMLWNQFSVKWLKNIHTGKTIYLVLPT